MHDFRELNKDSHKVHLSENEKKAIKNRVLATPINFPGTQPAFERLGSMFSPKFSFSALALTILVSCIPMTYAVQKSAPGNFLHRIELSVIEPIQGLTMLTASDRIAYSTDRLEERLQELHILGQEGISSSEIIDHTENIEGHANNILVELPEASAAEALDYLVEVSAILNAHEDVLADFGKKQVSLEDFNDEITQELSEQVGLFAGQQSSDELLQTIQDGVTETMELIKDSAAAEETGAIQERLKDVQAEIANGNLEEALHETVDAKVRALAQDYIENYDENPKQ